MLLHADRSVLAEHAAGPTPTAEALTYVMDRLYAEAGEVLGAQVGHQSVVALDELALLEMTASALDLLIARRRKRLAAANGHTSARMPLAQRDGRFTLMQPVTSGTSA